MSDVEPVRVPVYVLIDGFDQACSRFYKVMNTTDRYATFIPLFDALNWVVSIDDRFKAKWARRRRKSFPSWTEGFTYGDTVKGVRFARHRVHHHWANALWFSKSGAQLPFELGQRLGEWRWRLKLPKGKYEPDLERAYKAHVAANPARLTLNDLQQCFAETHGDLWRRTQ